MSFQLTINPDELKKFKIIVEEFNEPNYVILNENEKELKLQIVLINEENTHELQEELMVYLDSIHIEEIIGGG